jgi:hypothetical protein
MIKLVLNIGGSMKDSFDLYFSDCWRTYAKPLRDGKGVTYMVRTLATDTYNAKCALDLPAEFDWEVEKANVLAQLAKGIAPYPKPAQAST